MTFFVFSIRIGYKCAGLSLLTLVVGIPTTAIIFTLVVGIWFRDLLVFVLTSSSSLVVHYRVGFLQLRYPRLGFRFAFDRFATTPQVRVGFWALL